MANYVNWMAFTQQSKDGVIQTEGTPVADTETPNTGVATSVAPEGAQYASVWSTVNTQVQANNVKGGALLQNKIYTLPAATVLQIPNVIPKKTTIKMTDL